MSRVLNTITLHFSENKWCTGIGLDKKIKPYIHVHISPSNLAYSLGLDYICFGCPSLAAHGYSFKSWSAFCFLCLPQVNSLSYGLVPELETTSALEEYSSLLPKISVSMSCSELSLSFLCFEAFQTWSYHLTSFFSWGLSMLRTGAPTGTYTWTSFLGLQPSDCSKVFGLEWRPSSSNDSSSLLIGGLHCIALRARGGFYINRGIHDAAVSSPLSEFMHWMKGKFAQVSQNAWMTFLTAPCAGNREEQENTCTGKCSGWPLPLLHRQSNLYLLQEVLCCRENTMAERAERQSCSRRRGWKTAGGGSKWNNSSEYWIRAEDKLPYEGMGGSLKQQKHGEKAWKKMMRTKSQTRHICTFRLWF